MPPGKDYDDYWSIIRSGMWRLYYQLTKEGRRRYFEEIFGLAAHTKYLQIWTDCHWICSGTPIPPLTPPTLVQLLAFRVGPVSNTYRRYLYLCELQSTPQSWNFENPNSLICGRLAFSEEYRVDILGDRDASSWYLTFLGTLPAARGLGYARKLVEYVTRIVSLPLHHSTSQIYYV